MTLTELNTYIDILPQAYPFRMIDEIIDYKEGESLTAIKNITGNEWVFEGMDLRKPHHFPETLVIEAAAQAALLFYSISESGDYRKKFLLGRVDAEFSSQAVIGDVLKLKTDKHRKMENSGLMDVLCFNRDSQIAVIRIFYGVIE